MIAAYLIIAAVFAYFARVVIANEARAGWPAMEPGLRTVRGEDGAAYVLDLDSVPAWAWWTVSVAGGLLWPAILFGYGWRRWPLATAVVASVGLVVAYNHIW
jgi:hypothetical protein